MIRTTLIVLCALSLGFVGACSALRGAGRRFDAAGRTAGCEEAPDGVTLFCLVVLDLPDQAEFERLGRGVEHALEQGLGPDLFKSPISGKTPPPGGNSWSYSRFSGCLIGTSYSSAGVIRYELPVPPEPMRGDFQTRCQELLRPVMESSAGKHLWRVRVVQSSAPLPRDVHDLVLPNEIAPVGGLEGREDM